MARGICFVQVPLPSLQELVIPDQPWEISEGILCFQRAGEPYGEESSISIPLFLPWLPKEQQNSTRREVALSEAHSKGTPLFFFQSNSFPLCQAVPTLTGCPTLQDPPLLPQTLTMPCSPLPGPPTPDPQVSLGHYFILALFIVRFCS